MHPNGPESAFFRARSKCFLIRPRCLKNCRTGATLAEALSNQLIQSRRLKNGVVPEARLELASLAAEDFESPASTIPPLGPPVPI